MTLLHELFEAAAARSPHTTAVCASHRRLTYAELDRAATGLAVALGSGSGVRPGDLVAIALPPGPELVAAILAVLKAGAAYVPLDMAGPETRTRQILRDCRSRVLLTTLENAETCSIPGVTAVAVPPDLQYPEGALQAGLAAPEDLAYVIYTSGSTGEPKGVAVEHRQIVQSTLSRRAHYPRRPETFALLFSPAFDGSVAVIFWTLDSGGCLHLPDNARDEGVSELLSTGDPARPVTDLFCVPSLYRFILQHAAPSALSGLRRVVVGAEVCPPALTEEHFRRVPQASLHNEYGPTEAAVWSTVYDCPGPMRTAVPIGRPAPHAAVEILGEGLQPVPDGEVGELVVAGAGVARGYLHRPEMTAERFLIGADGSRKYRTGDLARRTAEGLIEYLGRNDDQIKLRGHRIEPGEVENALVAMPGVAEAVVVVIDAGASAALTGYLRPVQGAQLDLDEITRRLGDVLPRYMVPGAWRVVDDLLRTPNGKVDRRALRSLQADGAGPAPAVEGERQADEAQRRLCTLIGEVLGTAPVPPGEHIFRLGADSMAVMTMAALAVQEGLPLKPKDFFRAPTAVELAELVRSRSQSASPAGTSPSGVDHAQR